MRFASQNPAAARSFKRGRAFTLVEMLTVITIISLVLALGGLGISRSIRSTALLSASESLGNNLQLGIQLAVKENRPVELRFYKFAAEDGATDEVQFRAYQYVARNPTDGSVEPLENIRRLSGGVIFHPNPEYSTVFTLPERAPGSNDPQIGSNATEYTYVSFQYRPDGSTTLPKDSQWSLTLAQELEIEEGAGASLPKNYRSVTINAFNGAVRVY